MDKKQTNQLLKNDHLLSKRMLCAIMILIIYVYLSHIPLPYVNQHALSQTVMHQTSQTLSLLMMAAGGNISSGSILLVGLMPFMLVQMLVQLMQTGLVPAIKHMADEPNGAQKIGKVTTILSLVANFSVSYILLKVINQMSQGKIIHDQETLLLVSLIATVGAMILLYLAQLDTMFGLGNGMMFLIAISIMVQIFENNQHTQQTLIQLQHAFHTNMIGLILGGIGLLFIINTVCYWFQTSTYEIQLQFVGMDSSVKRNGTLPFSLNVTNIMPVIVTSMFMNLGLILARMYHWDEISIIFDFNHYQSVIAFCIIILIMCFMIALIQFFPRNISQKLQENGAYVVGHAPGKYTTWYLCRILTLLAFIQALFYLGLIGGLMIIAYQYGIDGNLVLGISSILIILGSLIDIGQQIKGLRQKQLRMELLN